MAQRLAQKLLIVGWDAADWKIIDPLFANGGMPNLNRLVTSGLRANLASPEPRLSPILWTTIATGKTADKHGILNFVEPDPSGVGMRIATSTSRKTKALWNILTQAGMRVNVVSWYASHPAEPINGVCVSNLFQEGLPATPDMAWPLMAGSVYPASLCSAIAETRVHPAGISDETLLPFVPNLRNLNPNDWRLRMLRRAIAQCASVHNAATTILSDDSLGAFDCTMVFYETIDSVGHNFMQYHPPRMDHVSAEEFEMFNEVMWGVYQFQDMMLGTLLELAGRDTTVIVLSDHGFHSDHLRPVIKIEEITEQERNAVETRWHRQFGVLAMSGPGIKHADRIYGASLFDITPTALMLLGLQPGADMYGRPLLEALDQPCSVEPVLSWDMIPGEAGMHPQEARVDPFEARDALRQLVDLGYMASPPADATAQHDLAWRETQANLGMVYFSSGQVELGTRIFEELVQRYPDEPRFGLALARGLFLGGQYDRCGEAVTVHLAKRPGDLEALVLLGMASASAGRREQTIRILNDIERMNGDRSHVALPLGRIHLALQDWVQAERCFRMAAECDPLSANACHGLAVAAMAQGRFEEAVNHALRGLDLVHFFPDLHYTLSVALTWLKDYDHAIKSFQVTLSMAPGLLDAHRYLASIYRHRGDRVNAAKHKVQAEKLMESRAAGTAYTEFLTRESPMGPQEWAQKMGMAADDSMSN